VTSSVSVLSSALAGEPGLHNPGCRCGPQWLGVWWRCCHRCCHRAGVLSRVPSPIPVRQRGQGPGTTHLAELAGDRERPRLRCPIIGIMTVRPGPGQRLPELVWVSHQVIMEEAEELRSALDEFSSSPQPGCPHELDRKATWPASRAATGESRTGCTGSATSSTTRTAPRSAPATAPASWPACATWPSPSCG
jgi:hypothetical protein